MSVLTLRGFEIYKGLLDTQAQGAVVKAVRAVVEKAPLLRPDTPYGKPMSVRMSAAGTYGWFSDKTGYRYIEAHPSGRPWPAIPAEVLAIWDQVTGLSRQPECCLINYYSADARMGLHQDKDEADFQWPGRVGVIGR